MHRIAVRMKRGRLCDWSELGQGTFGVVHVAYDENGNQMAVKKLRSMWYDYPLETVSELTCLALRHPHLAGMHGACRPSVSSSGDDSDSSAEAPQRHLWLCMPHGGRSLDAWLRAHRPSFDQVDRLMAQLLCGVEYMHSALGIYHGDIKPANVLIDSRSQIQICDFGAVGCIERRQGCRAEYKFTRWYRPPEVEYRRGVHARSDIWSLGCIGMELLLGSQMQSQYHVLFQGRSSGFTPYSPLSFSACGYESQMHVTLRGLLQLYMGARDVSFSEAERIVRVQLTAYMDDREEDLPPSPLLRIRDDGTEENMPPVTMEDTRRRIDAELRAAVASGPPCAYAFHSEHRDTAQLFLDMLHLRPECRPCATTARKRLKTSIVSADTDDDHAHLCAGAVRLLMARILARAQRDVRCRAERVSVERRELQAALALPFHPDADAAERRLAWCARFAATPAARHLSNRLGGFDTRLFPSRETPHAAVVRAWFQLIHALPCDDLDDAIDRMADHFRAPVPLAQPPPPRGCRPRTS